MVNENVFGKLKIVNSKILNLIGDFTIEEYIVIRTRN